MKKHYYLYIFLALAVAITLPSAVRAEENEDSNLPNTQNGRQERPLPAVRPGAPVPALLREQLRDKNENIQNNVEVRNRILENRKVGSSTRPEPRDGRALRADREDRDDDSRNASSSRERREDRNEMIRKVFEIRKNALMKQLEVAIDNLEKIRDRIKSRIEKAASSGRDMTAAKKALIIADAKITAAKEAVSDLEEYVPPTEPTASSSDPIILAKPRQIGDAAIKAVKEAHEALVAVVKAVAHAMGLGNTSTTTPPVIPPPATTTATSTTI